jgi:hypothetical protein
MLLYPRCVALDIANCKDFVSVTQMCICFIVAARQGMHGVAGFKTASECRRFTGSSMRRRGKTPLFLMKDVLVFA